jgi:hypothetical protein
MRNVQETLISRWQDIANLVLGLWLALSPWALGFITENSATWNAQIVGLAIAVLALAALWAFQKWYEWANAALGAWLIVSPDILGFVTLQAAMWNQAIVGILVAALAFWSALTTDHTGGIAAKT